LRSLDYKEFLTMLDMEDSRLSKNLFNTLDKKQNLEENNDFQGKDAQVNTKRIDQTRADLAALTLCSADFIQRIRRGDGDGGCNVGAGQVPEQAAASNPNSPPNASAAAAADSIECWDSSSSPADQ